MGHQAVTDPVDGDLCSHVHDQTAGIATWATLFLELAIGILVWNRRCRRYVLIAGVLLHGTILFTIAVGFFTPAMFVLYLAFVDAETIRRLPETSKNSAQHGLRRARSILAKLRNDDGRQPSQPPLNRDPQSRSKQRPHGKSERRSSGAALTQKIPVEDNTVLAE
jgi:hypothetical protein